MCLNVTAPKEPPLLRIVSLPVDVNVVAPEPEKLPYVASVSHEPLTVMAFCSKEKVPLMSRSLAEIVPPGRNVEPLHTRSSLFVPIVMPVDAALTRIFGISAATLVVVRALAREAFVTTADPDSERTMSLFWYRWIPVMALPEPRTTVTASSLSPCTKIVITVPPVIFAPESVNIPPASVVTVSDTLPPL